MTYIFEEWKEVLEKFQKCVDQGVEEMHQQKEEVQQIKDDIFSRLDSGNIIRDDRRIVLSAPEIIIGDVDKSGTLHLFESAIDLLSFATMCKQIGRDWRRDHLLSLAGVYRPRKELQESSMPLALTQYLKDHPGIRKIVLRLDNDYAGRTASQALQTMLSGSYEVSIRPPPEGKDYNDCLCMRLGIPITKTKERSAER